MKKRHTILKVTVAAIAGFIAGFKLSDFLNFEHEKDGLFEEMFDGPNDQYTCDPDDQYACATGAIQYAETWKEILSVATDKKIGVDGNIMICCYNSHEQSNDIIMRGQDRKILWECKSAIKPNASRTFRCGSDIYSIEIKQHGDFAETPSYCNVHYQ